MGKEDEIRLIAYSIWEEEGCVDGRDCEHWIKAETIWEQNQKGGTSPTPAKAKPKTTSKQEKKYTATGKKR